MRALRLVLVVLFLLPGCIETSNENGKASQGCKGHLEAGSSLRYSATERSVYGDGRSGIEMDGESLVDGRLNFTLVDAHSPRVATSLHLQSLHLTSRELTILVQAYVIVSEADTVMKDTPHDELDVAITDPLASGSYLLEICVEHYRGVEGSLVSDEWYSAEFEIP